MSNSTDLEIDVPEEFDDESYRAGAKAAFSLVASSSMQFSEAIDAPDTPDSTPQSGGDAGSGGEDGPGTCPECGRDRVYEMGREDPVCPDCDY